MLVQSGTDNQRASPKDDGAYSTPKQHTCHKDSELQPIGAGDSSGRLDHSNMVTRWHYMLVTYLPYMMTLEWYSCDAERMT